MATSKGKHLGEYRLYDMKKTDTPDKTGKHNLKV